MEDLDIEISDTSFISFGAPQLGGICCVEMNNNYDNIYDYINQQQAQQIIEHLQKAFDLPSILQLEMNGETCQTQGEVMTFPVISRVETPIKGKIESYFNGELLKEPVICGNVSYYTLENGDALKVKKDGD